MCKSKTEKIRVFRSDIERIKRIQKDTETSAQVMRRIITYYEIGKMGVCYGKI